MNVWIKKIRPRLENQFGGVCQELGCTQTQRLHFAHLKPTSLNGRGRGRKERYFDIKKHPKHYLLLCKRHHKEMDLQLATIGKVIMTFKPRSEFREEIN